MWAFLYAPASGHGGQRLQGAVGHLFSISIRTHQPPFETEDNYDDYQSETVLPLYDRKCDAEFPHRDHLPFLILVTRGHANVTVDLIFHLKFLHKKFKAVPHYSCGTAFCFILEKIPVLVTIFRRKIHRHLPFDFLFSSFIFIVYISRYVGFGKLRPPFFVI